MRLYFEQARPDNLGAVRLKGRTYRDGQGKERPLLVFRSGLTLQEGGGASACFRSLTGVAGVKHVINLYAGKFPFHDLIDQERAQAKSQGVEYFDLREHGDLGWRGLVEEEQQYEQNRGEAQRRVAKLIREQLLRPGGAAPRGNLYFHCAGGMHRSGMLFGVLRRCIKGYISESEPGGFEPLNLRFIREFDCSLIKAKK